MPLLRAHSLAGRLSLKVATSLVQDHYAWLAANPLRLPGEEV